MTSPQTEITTIINSINNGDPAGALARIEAFGAAAPVDLSYPKAIALAKLSRVQEAIAVVREMAAKFPGDARALGLLEELNGKATQPTKPTAGALLQKARELMASGQNYQAKEILIQAKALREPVEGLDFTRAQLFKGEGRLGDARECLNEELRFFPKNTSAAALLQEVRALETTNRPQIEDPEFHELLNQIRAYSMLPEERLYRVFALARQVTQSPLSGSFVECGVAGGGSSAMMAALMKRYRKSPGVLFACDSFSGMPDPTEHDTVSGQAANATGWGAGTCAAPEDSVREVSTKLGCSGIVKPVKGYFENTLPTCKVEIGKIALLHADCDWYSSLMTIFNELYDQVEPGGVIILDDYGYWEGIKKATDEFFAKRNIKATVQDLGGSAWFQKPY